MYLADMLTLSMSWYEEALCLDTYCCAKHSTQTCISLSSTSKSFFRSEFKILILSNGVSELNGAYLHIVRKVVSDNAKETGYVRIGGETYYPVNSNIMSRESISAIKLATNGVILGYHVIREYKVDTIWHVSLKLKIGTL